MNARVLGADTDPFVDGLPGPHSQRWFPDWTPDMLTEAIEIAGVDHATAVALVRVYPAERIKRQLRALCTRNVRISRALTLIEAVKTDRKIPDWMDPAKVPAPKSDYSGPYSTAKSWLETQADIAALLRKNGADGVQWGISERRKQASVLFEKAFSRDGAEQLLNVRLDLPLPDDIGERNAAFRALYHYLKSKFDVISFRFSDGSTMFDFESEFRVHLTTATGHDDLAIGAAKPLALASGSDVVPVRGDLYALRSADLVLSPESTPVRPRLKQIDQMLARLLRDVGVGEESARGLVSRYRDRCEMQLVALPFRWKIKNRAEYIVRAIVDDVGIPPRILRTLQRCADDREFEDLPETVRYRAELLVDEMISKSGARVPAAEREALERATVLELVSA